MKVILPAQKEFYQPTLEAFHNLGGAGTNHEIYDEVIRLMRISKEQLALPHKTSINMVVNRIQWAMDRLKRNNYVGNPRRGYWALTNIGWKCDLVDPENLPKEKMRQVERDRRDEMKDDFLPPVESMIKPTLNALREIGGEGRKAEIADIVVEKMQLTNDQVNALYPSGRVTFFNNRMNDVRKLLLSNDFIAQPRAGTWKLTNKGWNGLEVDIDALKRPRRRRNPRKAKALSQSAPVHSVEVIPLEEVINNHTNWQEQLLDVLRQLSPAKYESFLRLILQQSGLTQIDFMRSDDAVCEGIAVMGGGLMSQTRVNFRCLRGSRQLTSEYVTDFRREVGMSRAVHGMLIALGVFTQEAEREANRIKSPLIELVDGHKLSSILKDLGLGVRNEIIRVERVTVDPEFFDSI